MLICFDGITSCSIISVFPYKTSFSIIASAFFKAVSEGQRKFEAIAIVGNKENEEGEFCSPCGVCRQVMMEFCNPKEFKIYLAKDRNNFSDYIEYTLEELLPLGFGPSNLE